MTNKHMKVRLEKDALDALVPSWEEIAALNDAALTALVNFNDRTADALERATKAFEKFAFAWAEHEHTFAQIPVDSRGVLTTYAKRICEVCGHEELPVPAPVKLDVLWIKTKCAVNKYGHSCYRATFDHPPDYCMGCDQLCGIDVSEGWRDRQRREIAEVINV